MSVRVMHWVWEHSRAVGNDRLVLLAIADCANDRSEAWPSMAALVEKTRLSERTVQRAVQALVDLGELAAVIGGGRGKTTKYRLLTTWPPDKPRQENPVTEPETPSEEPRNPDTESEKPRQPRQETPSTTTRNPVTVTPGTVREPSRNRKKTPTGSSTGTRIPDDFTATAEMIEWARRETPLVGAKETETFVDYWRGRSDAGARKADWIATWRNWMRRAQSDAERRPARASPNGLVEHNGMKVRPETAERIAGRARLEAMDREREHQKAIEGGKP